MGKRTKHPMLDQYTEYMKALDLAQTLQGKLRMMEALISKPSEDDVNKMIGETRKELVSFIERFKDTAQYAEALRVVEEHNAKKAKKKEVTF